MVLAMRPTHITTKSMLFYIDGQPVTIPEGAEIKVFSMLSAAIRAAECAEKCDTNAKWAIKKLDEKGLLLAWIEGDVRGLNHSSVKPI